MSVQFQYICMLICYRLFKTSYFLYFPFVSPVKEFGASFEQILMPFIYVYIEKKLVYDNDNSYAEWILNRKAHFIC